jgi:large subunit ribosomal protein L15
MRIDQVNEGITKHRRPTRLGRGKGSCLGKLCGRGQDGAKSRRGFSRHPAQVGEDLPMIQRIPKRGFTNSFADDVVSVNVGDLDQVYDAGETVTPESLETKGVVKKRFDQIKILGDGEVTKALKISAHGFSASAEQKIKAAGGSITKLKVRRTPKERVADLKKGKAGK